MQCPQCNSENTQRLRIVYEGGTQAIQTTSSSAVLGAGHGFLGGGAVTTTSGVAQSGLAANAAPPMKKGYGGPLAVAAFFTGATALTPSAVLMWPLTALTYYWIWRRLQYNRTEWPPLFRAWDASWMCHRCGHMYQLAR